MAIPDMQFIMLPLLELAGDNEIRQMKDAVALLADRLDLTDDERHERMPSGQRRLKSRVAFARAPAESWPAGGFRVRTVPHHGARPARSQEQAFAS